MVWHCFYMVSALHFQIRMFFFCVYFWNRLGKKSDILCSFNVEFDSRVWSQFPLSDLTISYLQINLLKKLCVLHAVIYDRIRYCMLSFFVINQCRIWISIFSQSLFAWLHTASSHLFYEMNFGNVFFNCCCCCGFSNFSLSSLNRNHKVYSFIFKLIVIYK